MNERTVEHFYKNGWRKLTVVHISEVKEELNKKDCQISKLERKIHELELALSNSREHGWKLRKRFNDYRQRINELEAKNIEYLRKTQEQAKRIAELESQLPKWISVKDRLPNNGELVFVCFGERTKAHYFPTDVVRWDSSYELQEISVTHWMPLQPPPTTEEK